MNERPGSDDESTRSRDDRSASARESPDPRDGASGRAHHPWDADEPRPARDRSPRNVVPPGAGSHEWSPDDRLARAGEDDEELHPVMEAVGDGSIYLMFASLVLAIVGLAALAVGYQEYGRIFVTIAIVGGIGAMLLATIVGMHSQTLSLLDESES